VKRALGYCRVSTAIQVDQGISLEMQRARIEDYCRLYDLNLEAVHIDEGISGKSIAGRPGMMAILEAVKSKQLDAVVAYKLDRIARNAREALEIAELLQKHNVQLHCVSEKIDTGSAHGKLFYTLLSAMAVWERAIIAERTKAALAQKRSNGKRVSRYPPIGSKFAPDGRVVPNESEIAMIQRTLELREQGLSLRQISRQLFMEGIRNRYGRPYSTSVIHKIVNT
jgi:site-specific DNA recombinase